MGWRKSTRGCKRCLQMKFAADAANDMLFCPEKFSKCFNLTFVRESSADAGGRTTSL